MMEERNEKLQGQRGSKPRPLCPVCGSYLVSVCRTIAGSYKRVGFACTNPKCKYIEKDQFR